MRENYHHFRSLNATYNRPINGMLVQTVGFKVAYSESRYHISDPLEERARIQIFGILPQGSGRISITKLHIPLQITESYKEYKDAEVQRIRDVIGLIRSGLGQEPFEVDYAKFGWNRPIYPRKVALRRSKSTIEDVLYSVNKSSPLICVNTRSELHF